MVLSEAFTRSTRAESANPGLSAGSRSASNSHSQKKVDAFSLRFTHSQVKAQKEVRQEREEEMLGTGVDFILNQFYIHLNPIGLLCLGC
jgi:hypothetical protein